MKIKLIIFLSLIISLMLAAQGDLITWSRTFDGICHQEDVAYDVEQTSDGGYVVAGVKWDQAPFSPDWIFPHMWVLKLDANGDTLWTTTYYHNIEISDPFYNDYYFHYAEAYDIEETNDSCFIVCGYVEVNEGEFFFEAEKNMCVVKLDQSGNIEWKKTFLEGYNNVSKTIKQTSDGGYVVGGYIQTINAMDSSKYDTVSKILRLDANGDSLWTRNYQESDAFPLTGIKSTILYKIDTNIQNEIFGVGTIYNGESSNGWLIKIDENGNTLWSKDFGDIEGESFYDIQITNDNNLILIGSQYVRTQDATGIWINKVSMNGDLIFEKTIQSGYYNEYDYGKSICQTYDGGYIIGAETNQLGIFRDWWIIKTDSSGDILWTKIYGSYSPDYLWSINQTSDGGYIVCGDTEGSYASDNSMDWTDMWVLKLDQYGNYTGIENSDELLIKDFNLYQNYPNPFNPVTQIKFALSKTAEIKLNVYNISGQKVAELANGTRQAGVHTVDFDGSDLNSGVYYYTLKTEGKSLTKKMLLVK